MSADLNGKKVLVTGASSGIGLATVETFARHGATVALNYLPDDPRGARETIDRLNKEGLGVRGAPGDVSKPGEAQSWFSKSFKRSAVLITSSIMPAFRAQKSRSLAATWADSRKIFGTPYSRRISLARFVV